MFKTKRMQPFILSMVTCSVSINVSCVLMSCYAWKCPDTEPKMSSVQIIQTSVLIQQSQMSCASPSGSLDLSSCLSAACCKCGPCPVLQLRLYLLLGSPCQLHGVHIYEWATAALCCTGVRWQCGDVSPCCVRLSALGCAKTVCLGAC